MKEKNKLPDYNEGIVTLSRDGEILEVTVDDKLKTTRNVIVVVLWLCFKSLTGIPQITDAFC